MGDIDEVALILGFVIITLLQSWVFMLLASSIGFGTVVVPMGGAVLSAFLLGKFLKIVAAEMSNGDV